MRQTYQFSLFGTSSGKGLLFSRGVLGQYLEDARTTPIPAEIEKAKTISEWLDSVAQTEASEASLEARFLQDIMVGVLGYVLYPAGGSAASLYPKPPKSVTRISRTPDAMLGAFRDEDLRFTAALELKTPGTDLDLPQAREGSETPVEQGLYYGRRILGVRWVLVSDMRVLRLYSVESQAEYEEFDLRQCVGDDGTPTEAFRRLHLLLHHGNLVAGHDAAPVAMLYSKTTERQLAIRDSFYQVYYDIRADLYEAIRKASAVLPREPSHSDALEATQRLLDRLLFIYYCEDHPQTLLPRGTVKRVTTAARSMPGPSPSKVYDHLKHLFREVDGGSPVSSGMQLPAYNGELFKDHWIIDHIDLPDSLHDKRYDVDDASGKRRIIQGVWGLHEFDFWVELNEHLLGHIFEESLSDLAQLGSVATQSSSEKIQERKRNGIFYTSSLLSDFLSESALQAVLNERAPIDAASPHNLASSLQKRLDTLLGLRVLDPACGSGAFLVSAFRELLEEYWRLRALIETTKDKKAVSLFDAVGVQDQATLLRRSLFGIDLLPQAVEIAKLALWLRSARKGEKVADLGGNILVGNSLDLPVFFSLLKSSPGSFDLVIGNPPWGGEVESVSYAAAVQALGVDDEKWDSWELFVMLALRALREGGRMALVLPDSFLYEDKKSIRELLFASASIEKVYNLGPDWFGKQVRMGTLVVQARRGPTQPDATMLCGLLAGSLRTQAIQGRLPLTQVEAQRARRVPVARSLASPRREIEVFRGKRDDTIMGTMVARSMALGNLCTRARGEEMNKGGTAWGCPSCLSPTVPGEKKKGGGYKSKKCPTCGHTISEETATRLTLVTDVQPSSSTGWAAFIDGDDVSRRYQAVTASKWLNTAVPGWHYKDAALYEPPKLLVRQAGVGIVATLDRTSARCPQSVYIYRLLERYAAAGYSHEFVLAALLSRTMAYYVFKRFGEIDPAKAHAKLTHERLSTLPIPLVNFTDRVQQGAHDAVTANATALLAGTAPLGGAEDRAVELGLRQFWGLSPDDGAYINREFLDVPDSQVVRDLFPSGVPKASSAA